MTVEMKSSSYAAQEQQPRETQYSCHPQLDEYLRQIDKSLPILREPGFSIDEASRLIRFESRMSHFQLRRVLGQAKFNDLLKTRRTISSWKLFHRYQREHLLMAAAAVQIRAQGVVWDNIPYILYHYVTVPKLREVLNRPRQPYDPTREWDKLMAKRIRATFGKEDQELLIKAGDIDLSPETVLSDIPEDFYQPPEPIAEIEKPLTQQTRWTEKESIILSLARLRWLDAFLRYESPIKPFQMDTVSAGKLQLGGFTLEEAEAVFEEFNQISKNGELTDEYKTYYVLKNAIVAILKNREKAEVSPNS